MKIYNPTYGALFEVDETHPADPAAVGRWTLNYTAPGRGLTPNEIAELKAKGKIGFYPDEFFLVDDTAQWPLEKALSHQRAVQAFQKTNENGPIHPHWDRVASINKRDRVTVNFVPGPIVDQILTESGDSAVENVYRTILADAGATFRTNKEFQGKARVHAHSLVHAVREMCSSARNGKTSAQNNSSPLIRESILKFLHDEEQLCSPREIANRTGLNRNTVRRELQQLLSKGLITRQEHKYGLKSEALEKGFSTNCESRDDSSALTNREPHVEPENGNGKGLHVTTG